MKAKKIFVAAMMCALSLVAVGCADTENTSETEEQSQSGVDTNSFDEQIKKSCWSGVDAKGNSYVLSMEEGNYTFVVRGAEGETQMDGTYSLGENGLEFLKSDEAQSELNKLECEVCLDGENPFIKINDIYLSKATVDDYKEQIENIDLAASVAEYLSSGHVWIACYKDNVVLLDFNGQQIERVALSKNGENISKETVDAEWCISNDVFAFFDVTTGKQLENFAWDFQEEEELKVLSVDSDQEKFVFYELQQDSMDNGVALAESYLNNQKEADDIQDFTTVLNGYEGVSIVDAFVFAGLNPQIENRAIFAEKFNIENYRGTSEQNLFLLESMGGVVK